MDVFDANRLLPRSNIDRVPSPAFVTSNEDFVEMLKNPDFDTRLQTLNRLMALVKRDPDWFAKFAKKGELFKNLDRILSEDRWEVQHQGIKFLMEAMPSFGSNMEYCVCYVMPNLVPKLGSSKVTVRRVTVQAIQTFLKMEPNGLQTVTKLIVNYMLNTTPERYMKLEVLCELPNLFQAQLKEGNWSALVDGLTKWMLAVDKEAAEKAATVLKKLEVFIGTAAFSKNLENVPEKQRNEYQKLEKNISVEPQKEEDVSDALKTNRLLAKSGERRFRFAIVPTYIEAMLNDEDASTRMAALEKLKGIIEKISPEEIMKFAPHLHSYFVQIGHVLGDLNFKVVVMALDLVRLTVNRLKQYIEPHLPQVIQLISRHFGNQKAVIKQIIMMTCMDLLHNLDPKAVVAVLRVFLENKNSRTREEVVNILTAALMTANPCQVNFSAMSNILVPMLADPKRRVRLAAFEQLSVVAYLMNGKIEPLLKAVREAEEKMSLPGLKNACMARLRRHLLPRIRYDGLVEYATPPITDSAFDIEEEKLKQSENLDLYWILHANVGGSGERPLSPLSISNFKMENRMSGKRPKTSKPRNPQPMPWETESDATTPTMPMPFVERMQSDDQIYRKPGSSNAVHPNESTASWHSPDTKRNNSITVDDPRSASAIVNRLNGNANSELDHSLDRVRFHALQRKHELNNNSIHQTTTVAATATHQTTHYKASAATKPKPKPKAKLPAANGNIGLSRARSDGNLTEERENQKPVNYDDMPIKPAKNGQPMDEYPSYEAPSFANGMAKKSISHHSLPVASNMARQVKKAAFLKSGQGNRVKPAPVAKASAASRQSLPLERSRATEGGGNVPMALRKMEKEEWQDKVDGLNILFDLSRTNPGQLTDNLTEVIKSVLNECKNLRSSVSRVALSGLGTLFTNLKGRMDPEIEKCCAVLMQRCGDVSNAFIREDANEAMEQLVKYGSPIRVLQSLINSGAKSKHNTIRSSCAGFTSQLVDRLGNNGVLNSPDFMAKLIPQMNIFAKDQTPDVRKLAKTILYNLSQEPKFEQQLRKACTEHDVKNVREVLGNIDKKGGVDSLDATSSSLGAALSRTGSVKRVQGAVQRKLPDNVQLDLDECRNDLTAAGWEKRLTGLERFEEMTNSMPKAVASDTKLIEAFIGRVSDINSKVSLDGMDTYLATLPVMSRFYSSEASLKAVLNQLVLSLMSHLPSKSDDHRRTAQKSLQETVKQIDGAALAPAIAAATRKANVKQKPWMLQTFSQMNKTLYAMKPKQVEVHSLPILVELMKTPPADADNKKAFVDFARCLARLMGDRALLDAASTGIDPSKKAMLEQMIR